MWLNKVSGAECSTEAPVAAASACSTMGAKRRKTAVSSIANLLQELPSPTDAAQILVSAMQKVESIWPGFAGQVVNGLDLKTEGDAAECACCAKLLEGMFSLPGFAAPYPDEKVNQIRHSVDRLVRTTFGDRDMVNRLGYAIGTKRWNNASQDTPPERSQRGKPSEVNSPENVAKVKELLQKFSQPSSTPCLNTDGDWVLAQTLTKRRKTLFEENQDVRENMSSKAPAIDFSIL